MGALQKIVLSYSHIYISSSVPQAPFMNYLITWLQLTV